MSKFIQMGGTNRAAAEVVAMASDARGRGRLVAELFDAHYSSLRGLAYVILGDSAAAEEIASEVFVRHSQDGTDSAPSSIHPRNSGR